MKIVIETSGGVVDTVHASEPGVVVGLLDWDEVNDGAKISAKEESELLAEATKDTPHIARWEAQQPATPMSLNIPEHENEGDKYPGDIHPGSYSHEQVVELLRQHKADPEAVQFIADMLER